MRRLIFLSLGLSSAACTGGKHYTSIGAGDAGDVDGGNLDGATADGAAPMDAACADLCDAYCLRGTLTVTNAFDTVNSNPSTMAFEHLEQNPTDYRFVFDVMSSAVMVGNGTSFPQGQLRVLDIKIRSFSFADSFMNNVFGPAYAGMEYGQLALVNGPTVGVSMGNMVSPTASQYWGMEADITAAPIQVAQDGSPILAPTTGAGSGSGGTPNGVLLRRYQTATPMLTDYAETSWTVALKRGADCL